MGMFDSLYDANRHEWQTKAFDCVLAIYNIGDTITADVDGDLTSFQVEVLGGPDLHDSQDSFATIIDRRVVSVPAERDRALPLLDYYGGILEAAS